MFKITYFHTVYKENVTELTDKVDFYNGAAVFSAMGRKHAIPMKILVSIEAVEE